MTDSTEVEYPRYLMMVGGEKKFMTRVETQNLLFDRDDVVIDGRVHVSADYIVTVGYDKALAEIFEAADGSNGST